MLAPWKKSHDKPRQHIKKQRHHFANKSPSSQNYVFSCSHVLMWELNHKEGWVLKKWCFSTVVLEKTLESPLDCKDIKPVNPIRNEPWIFIGRTDAKAEAPILWPSNGRAESLDKTLMLGKLEGRRRMGQQRMKWLDSITNSMDMIWAHSGRQRMTAEPGMLQSMQSQRVRYDVATEQTHQTIFYHTEKFETTNFQTVHVCIFALNMVACSKFFSLEII